MKADVPVPSDQDGLSSHAASSSNLSTHSTDPYGSHFIAQAKTCAARIDQILAM